VAEGEDEFKMGKRKRILDIGFLINLNEKETGP
jgi:hypothetical protein